MSGYTEEQRKSLLVYNFSIASNDQDLLERAKSLAAPLNMPVAAQTKPDEIIGLDPTEQTRKYKYAARFEGAPDSRIAGHPTLQQVWEYAGLLHEDNMNVGVIRPGTATPTGSFPTMVLVLEKK